MFRAGYDDDGKHTAPTGVFVPGIVLHPLGAGADAGGGVGAGAGVEADVDDPLLTVMLTTPAPTIELSEAYPLHST